MDDMLQLIAFLSGQRRLLDMQPLGGACEVEFFGNGDVCACPKSIVVGRLR